MTWLRTVFVEIFGLFVDDGSFALLILAWVGLTAFLLPYLGWASPLRGLVLFAGLAAILLGSAIRYTCRRT